MSNKLPTEDIYRFPTAILADELILALEAFEMNETEENREQIILIQNELDRRKMR